MDTLLYIIIFIMGTVFGSFYTLAVHRIPKRQDITHTHSYCPNCNHKLGFLDLIPVFSYIFLGAKCRYCKEKIRPRYFIIELLSGISFVVISYLMNVKVESLNLIPIAEGAFMALYLCFIFLMSGIDKEYRRIEKSVTIYGIIISIMYIVYLCVIEHASIYRYIIYLIFYILILILDTITLKIYAKNSYINGIILTVLTMCIFTGECVTINTIILVALAIAFTILLTKIKNLVNKNRKKDEHIAQKISIGFYLGVANIINLIFVLAYYKFLV
ncbi:MAG: prepilin peptidase [Clostridium sp.]|nr:prepilin peptidase [Clostridium sp.]